MDYTECDNYINASLDNDMSIEQIKLLGTSNEEEAEEALEELIDDGWDEDLSLTSWFDYVDRYKKENPIPIEICSATIGDAIEDINLNQLIDNPNSSWNKLKSNFRANGISAKSIREIEASAHRVLTCLSADTRGTGPIKGLVFGSVQSGKTANMEALISMAADTQWNVFIILSGTIENLRIQTRDRFKRDLLTTSSIAWKHIDLSGDDRKFKTTSMRLDSKGEFASGARYVITCLKQKSRLRKLNDWLYADPDKARRMRVIVIDDEADQASINTAPILEGEDAIEYEQARKEINRLIVCLANGLKADGGKPKEQLQAMNYISYTATPYANVLNERPGESLYPKDFVHSLSTPDEYFGINVIFGNPSYVDDSGSPLAPGLDIIRTIPQDDAAEIKGAHKEEYGRAPESLKDAVCWFLCCAAALRYKQHRKPISMLIHTSNKGDDHATDYHLIHDYLKATPLPTVFKRCETVYSYETTRFTYNDFARDFSKYGLLDQVDPSYPSFGSIKDEIAELVSAVGNIKLGDDDTLSYSSGINVCIDDCFADRRADDDTKMRLVYPSKDELTKMAKAPVFIVIGGNTLARGLTIEGLVCSYFTRNTTQADTLMQMARWFGYRRGYELLPRIWLTDEITSKYRALSKVEMSLKEEIKRFEELGLRPEELGVKVQTMPEVSKFMLTAKNKMQSARACMLDFTGYSYEITEFDFDEPMLKQNLTITTSFLDTLSNGRAATRAGNAVIWKNVGSPSILDFMRNYQLSPRSSVTRDDIDCLSSWIQGSGSTSIDYWNVAIAGKSNAPSGTWACAGANNLPKIERTRLSKHDDYIDIGSLRSGSDALCDIDIASLGSDELNILHAGGMNTNVANKRAELGFSHVPLLLIYRIDSTSQRQSATRRPIGTETDIISFAIIIPGDKYSSRSSGSVWIPISQER